MGYQQQTNISREEFMSFFKDSSKIKMLSEDDKTEIVVQLLSNDGNLLVKLLHNFNGSYDSSIYQLIEERNSLPVF